MRAFPVSVPQAGRVRLAWFHQTGAVVAGGKSRAPASSRAGGSRLQSPVLSPWVLSHLLWEAPKAEDDLGWPFPS